jgi:hypothetical protein
MKRLLAALPLVLVLACGPSVNPKLKAATQGIIAGAKGGHSESAMRSFAPGSWKAGQWVLVKYTDLKKHEVSVMKMSVLDATSEGLWVENEHWDSYSHGVSKILYSRMPRTAQDMADVILKIITKQDGQDQQVMDFTKNDPATQMIKSMMRSTLQGSYMPEFETVGSESVTVAAGTFAGCTKTTTKMTAGPFKQESVGWFHPAVPLNAMVKAAATDGSWEMELLDYGTSGAVSSFK